MYLSVCIRMESGGGFLDGKEHLGGPNGNMSIVNDVGGEKCMAGVNVCVCVDRGKG